MSIDLALILTRARHPLRALKAHTVLHRAEEDPKRVVRAEIRFAIEGAVPKPRHPRDRAVARQVLLCLAVTRQDIELIVTFELSQAATA